LEPLGHWIHAKRLTGNDTGLTGGHQAGPHIPKDVLFAGFPGSFPASEVNPKHFVTLHIDSHDRTSTATLTWYNNRLFGGTRNESRMTGLGGSNSPFLDQSNTGALSVFVIADRQSMHCWICKDAAEEDAVEAILGPIDPLDSLTISPDGETVRRVGSRVVGQPSGAICPHSQESLPSEWLSKFPGGSEILEE
jgi:hypothetical protein